MDETKVQIGEDVLLDIGIHSDWYIGAVSYNGESVSVDLRRKADRHKEWWLADTPQAEMTEDDAFYIVYKDLTKDEGLFTGRYDAKNGSKQYMHGINSVMEYIAYRVGEDCLDAWVDRFAKNMIESQEKAERNE